MSDDAATAVSAVAEAAYKEHYGSAEVSCAMEATACGNSRITSFTDEDYCGAGDVYCRDGPFGEAASVRIADDAESSVALSVAEYGGEYGAVASASYREAAVYGASSRDVLFVMDDVCSAE